jgi:hypothetical protein
VVIFVADLHTEPDRPPPPPLATATMTRMEVWGSLLMVYGPPAAVLVLVGRRDAQLLVVTISRCGFRRVCGQCL